MPTYWIINAITSIPKLPLSFRSKLNTTSIARTTHLPSQLRWPTAHPSLSWSLTNLSSRPFLLSQRESILWRHRITEETAKYRFMFFTTRIWTLPFWVVRNRRKVEARSSRLSWQCRKYLLSLSCWFARKTSNFGRRTKIYSKPWPPARSSCWSDHLYQLLPSYYSIVIN